MTLSEHTLKPLSAMFSESESFTPPLGELVAELVGVGGTSDTLGNTRAFA